MKSFHEIFVETGFRKQNFRPNGKSRKKNKFATVDA
jgi:hypothetical protein